ncbi:MAG TPA: tripartite tricarboxylate transporter substrate binding protein [Xanthobacteraceae bacterium]|nr:tripartite tricarboxylate transporter substrate binding protein [Xanthobacteraceae bacterium]
MKIIRRRFLRAAVAAASAPLLPRVACALDYPTRPVHMVDGFAAGGSIDIVARLLGQWLSQRLGQSFLVDNRPGAATNIAAEEVVRAAPDGYTLLWTTSANAINATLYAHLNFNFLRDISPVASIDRFPFVMEVNPALPVKTIPEFIAYAKANPGKVNFGSGGVGSVQHVAGELFKFMTGVDIVHVPYRGAALVLNDLLAGQVQVTFSPIPLSIGYIRNNQVRALGVTSATRAAALPDVPAVAEFVPGYEATAVDGIGAPKATPAEIIDKLNGEINTWLADKGAQARLADLGGSPLPLSPAEVGKLYAAETEKWAKVIKFAGIKAE